MLSLILLLSGCNLLNSGGTQSASPPPAEDTAAPPVKSRTHKKTHKKSAKPSAKKGPLIQAGTTSGPGEVPVTLTENQCKDMADGGPLKGPDCVTDTIECGQTIVGHTRGGVDLFNTRWYERNFCWPGTIQRDGGDERVYRFRFPDDGRWRAKFTLDSPCADLDITAFTWKKSTCPTAKSDIGGWGECDAHHEDGPTREYAEAVTDGNWRDWLVVVEGIGDDEGAFSISVQCVNDVHW